jgi:hypothetical protein
MLFHKFIHEGSLLFNGINWMFCRNVFFLPEKKTANVLYVALCLRQYIIRVMFSAYWPFIIRGPNIYKQERGIPI